MKNRKLISAAMAVALATTLAACGGNTGGTDTNSNAPAGTLEVFLNMPAGSPQEGVMRELVSEFEEAENVDVSVTVGPSGYSEDMRVKIASNSLPDVFATHGWSVMRYSPYLLPLDDQPWVENVHPGLKDIVFDDEGHIYTLPLEYAISGLAMNFDVLDQAGVDPSSLDSWDGVEAAMAKVKEAGISPITSSAQENAGDVGNYIASGQFTESEQQRFADEEFDTGLWVERVAGKLETWTKAGYFNPDFVSAKQDDMARQLADGSAAFAFAFPFVLATANEYNPDANLGFMPIPGQEQNYLVGGEGVQSYGVAKDSDMQAEALAFLNHLAQPENAIRLVESMNAYSGLTTVNADLGSLQSSFDEWVTPGEYPTRPFFDRVYLPSGMWSTLVSTSDGIINGQLTAADAAEQMKQQYDTLKAE
ncbi:MAG: ABC transporter substrate-binding protein [Propionibacteriaceae bacterium]|nr:ABC transporter substrate-binding protein [Propionibacteriaceae bacterium]